jgi:HEAT repeat protein
VDELKLPNVEEMKAKNDIPGLINALKVQGDQHIRETVVKALHIRMDAAEALGEIRDLQAVDPLAEASTEYNSLVRRKALIALGKIGGHRVVEPLIAALYDQYSENTECAAVQLRNLLNSSLDEASKKKIRSVETIISKEIESVESKKKLLLDNARKTWSNMPMLIRNRQFCTSCYTQILAGDGTAVTGSVMWCKKCTEEMFIRWDKKGPDLRRIYGD